MVDYIEWDGKTYPVLFGHVAIKEFEAASGKLFQDIGEDMEEHALLLWHAIKIAHRRLKEPFVVDGVEVITKEDCLWILDERWPQYFALVVKSMADLAEMTVEELVQRGMEIDAELKKNQVTAKKKPLKTPVGKK